MEPWWASEAARRQLRAGESDSGERPCCSDLDQRRRLTHTADPGARVAKSAKIEIRSTSLAPRGMAWKVPGSTTWLRSFQ